MFNTASSAAFASDFVLHWWVFTLNVLLATFYFGTLPLLEPHVMHTEEITAFPKGCSFPQHAYFNKAYINGEVLQ